MTHIPTRDMGGRPTSLHTINRDMEYLSHLGVGIWIAHIPSVRVREQGRELAHGDYDRLSKEIAND